MVAFLLLNSIIACGLWLVAYLIVCGCWWLGFRNSLVSFTWNSIEVFVDQWLSNVMPFLYFVPFLTEF